MFLKKPKNGEPIEYVVDGYNIQLRLFRVDSYNLSIFAVRKINMIR